MIEKQDSKFRWGTVAFNNPLSIRLDGETSPIGISPDSLIDPASLLVGDRVWCQLVAKRVVVIGTAKGGSSPWVACTLGGQGVLGGSGSSQHHVRKLSGGLIEISLDLAFNGGSGSMMILPTWAQPNKTLRYACASNSGASGSPHIDVWTTATLYGTTGVSWVALNMMYRVDRP